MSGIEQEVLLQESYQEGEVCEIFISPTLLQHGTEGNEFLLSNNFQLSLDNTSPQEFEAGEIESGIDDILFGQEANDFYKTIVKIVHFTSIPFGYTKEEREDLVQDVCERVIRKQHLYDASKSKFSTWAIRVTRNMIYDDKRKRRIAEISQDQNENISYQFHSKASDSLPEDETLSRDVFENLYNAVASLSVEQKEALEMVFFKGYTHAEAAFIMNKPLGTLKSRVRTALLNLRNILSKEDLEIF